ncbi:MAG: phosphoglycerate dehydrogenase [Clostridiales bacterium]|nr:phosphoglycerate dehydrogenase [Clostridiales bacterium]
MKKILITPRSFSKARHVADNILANYEQIEIVENTTGKTLSEENMAKLCSDIDGVIVGIDPMSVKVLKGAKRLKAISKYGAGLDNIDLDMTKKLNIEVDRAANANALSVAELAVGLMFTIARDIVPTAINVKRGIWERAKVAGCELRGKTAGIVGLGAIGKEVAKMVKGIGMDVIAFDPYLKDKDVIRTYDISMVELDELFKTADFISLHCPLTDETRHIIDEDTLSIMKTTAYLINTSRGELVDEEALYKALIGKTIAGAAQDVFSKEPAGKHKLLDLPNFVLTPHTGAYTRESTERMVEQATQNLVRMLELRKR